MKDAILFVKEKAINLRNFTEMKFLAVEQEDYEVAKRLKSLIDIENKNI